MLNLAEKDDLAKLVLRLAARDNSVMQDYLNSHIRKLLLTDNLALSLFREDSRIGILSKGRTLIN